MKSYKLKINGTNYAVNINNIDGQIIDLELNGTPYKVEIDKDIKQSKTPKLLRSVAVPSTDIAPQVAKTAVNVSGSGTSVKSPLPGTILDVYVNVGDNVSIGQKLFMLEAMKMENQIDSDVSGTVKAIKISKGASVMEGDVLLIIGD
ncbi:MAG: biotin/lipoyl-binding protein [Bacteroidales bacterium]|jgi:biotin carboxyl carrier protein|nr:biotin/lipoyl-binding protein [Bacteroidales bacterium]